MIRAGPARPSLFVDTSAIFALFNERDPNHALAHAAVQRAYRERSALITTNFVVAEAHALMLARRGRARAAGLLDAVTRGPSTVVVRASEDDEDAARAIIYDYDDKDFSLTNAISFAVMRRLGIVTAFTFDRDFARLGFASVP
jgi:predicted nucleic acid-binding protein